MAGRHPEALSPAAPALEFVFRIRARVGALRRAGPGLAGERLHIPILGGRVEGPRLQGKILPGGSDWALQRTDGSTAVEAHYSVQAADGTLIYVHNRGLRVSSPEVLERLQRGEAVPPHEFYFRSTPVFDAPDGTHAWLREHLFVAPVHRLGDEVRIDVFVVR